MSQPAETQVAVLTPTGRGALASVVVEGPQATECVGRLFHPAGGRPLESYPCGRIVFGRWRRADTDEEVVICRRREDQVEIHSHGGLAASAAIVDDLTDLGCRPQDWQSWVTSHESDIIAAEARIALSTAPTLRTAAVLLDQYRGALRGAIEHVQFLIGQREHQSARAAIDDLLRFAPLGQHLTEPWRVVLVGRPNVGKSSLTNAILGYTRAIVHETAGTTRDLVTAPATIDGWPVELVDTAGLRASDDPLEASGISLAEAELVAADLVVLVADASVAWSADDEALAARAPGALIVHNKSDLPQHPAPRPEGIAVSARTGQRMDHLLETIARRLAPCCPAPGQAVPFTSRQVAALEVLRRQLAAGALPDDASALGF